MLYIMIYIFAVVCGVVLALRIQRDRKKSKEEKVAIRYAKNKKKYEKLANNFLTYKAIKAIYRELAQLSIYERKDLYVLSVMYFERSWAVFLGVLFLSIVIFKNILIICLCSVLAYRVQRGVMQKKLDYQYNLVLKAVVEALNNIQQGYKQKGSIVEAMYIMEKPAILVKPLSIIEGILTEEDGDRRLETFCNQTPFRPLATLAGVCYTINSKGDTEGVRGQSNFLEALDIIMLDVNAEIRKMHLITTRFKGIEYLPLVPIVGIGFLESYFVKIMPGTALMYGGALGYLSRVVIVLSSLWAHEYVTQITRYAPIKENDKVHWAMWLMARQKWRQAIEKITPKNEKRRKMGLKLREALTMQTIEEIYTQKVVICLVAFVFTLGLFYTAAKAGRTYVTASTAQLSLVATDEMQQYTNETILELDTVYTMQRDAMAAPLPLQEELSLKLKSLVGPLTSAEKEKLVEYPAPSVESVTELVKGFMPALTDLQVQDQVKRLNDKYKAIKTTKFHWWMVWLSALVGLAGWKYPTKAQAKRRELVLVEAEEDFLQLQTLMSILMSLNIDTMDALKELAQHSRIHKDMLFYCYHSYPSDPELELTRLQAKTELPEFKRFIATLKLTIDQLSLEEAYTSLKVEREQIMTIRERTIEVNLLTKRAKCGSIIKIPMGLMVLGELLIPLGYLGYKEFANALSMM